MNPLSYIRIGAFGVLLGIIAWLVIGTHGLLWIEGDKRHIARLQSEVADMHKAGELALAAQDSQNRATEAAYRRLSEESDAEHQTALEGARRAVSDYARAHRVQPQNRCGPGPAELAPVPDPSEAPDSPAAGSELVAITRSDLDALGELAVRAASNRQWGLSLIEQGLALPEPDFAQ